MFEWILRNTDIRYKTQMYRWCHYVETLEDEELENNWVVAGKKYTIITNLMSTT